MSKDIKPVLMSARNLTKWFPVQRWFFEQQQYVKAVDGVSFDLFKGETLGIVGESGCGKSTLARTLLRLLEATDGEVNYDNECINDMDHKKLRGMRKNIQIVFQDPYSSLHPRMRIGEILEEPMKITKSVDKAHRKDRVKELLTMVGLDESYIYRYPHEFSGGQRQRIVIARALATNPSLIICDEPVSALDVSVRAQILNLLEKLQDEMGLTYIFISHDLSVIEHICDRTAIMYLGQLAELGETGEIFDNPRHPYTKALLSAIPKVDDMRQGERILLKGDIPNPSNPPEGCRFRTRCNYAADVCRTKPEAYEIMEGHIVACHLISKDGGLASVVSGQ